MTGPASTSPAGTGELRLDLDLAQEAVNELIQVREELADLRAKAQEMHRLAQVDRPARDLVSLEAADVLAAKADVAPGSLGLALDDGILHVQSLIDRMNADMAEQRRIDGEAARVLRVS